MMELVYLNEHWPLKMPAIWKSDREQQIAKEYRKLELTKKEE